MKVTDLTGLKPFIKIDEELGLHLARPELAEAIFKAVDKDRLYLRQWLPWVDGTRSAADSSAFIQHSMKMNARGDQLITFLIWKGQLAGSLGVVKFIKDRKSCEVGYWLRSDLQGKGIMTRACTAFINYLFRQKNLNRIEILVASGNAKSKAVCKRLGFSHEGTLRQALWLYDNYHDLELYAMLKDDWMDRDA